MLPIFNSALAQIYNKSESAEETQVNIDLFADSSSLMRGTGNRIFKKNKQKRLRLTQFIVSLQGSNE